MTRYIDVNDLGHPVRLGVFSLEDYSVLRYILDTAKALNIGSEIELVSDLFVRRQPNDAMPQKKRA
ncbi:hypothetical protein J3D48_006232 [Pseudomonas fluorescens]|nr:hypothetical protein [Pseudomonas fluorescens]